MLTRIAHFRIGDGDHPVAVAGFAFAWPMLFALVIGMICFGATCQGVCHLAAKRNVTLIEVLLVASIIGVLIGLYLPSVHSNCRRRAAGPFVGCTVPPPIEEDEEFLFYFGEE